MKNRISVAAALVALATLSGCANPYAQFYEGTPDARALPEYVPQTTPLEIFSTNDFDRDVQAMVRRGYQAVGNASFNAGTNAVSEAQLRAQAEKIGAHAVLVSSQYTHSVTGAIPMQVPQSSTSYSTGSATAYGSGGTVTATGSSTTTTYGSQTVMMPYTVQRADFGAVFLVKRRWVLGVQTVPLDDATRARLQSNRGAIVAVVVDDTPAFNADILPGDVLLRIADEPIGNPDTFSNLTQRYVGQTVEIELERGGARIVKKITLGGN